jgi:anti-sigma factor RsiW
MSKHFPTEQLINFADGIFVAGESSKVKEHLAQCASCEKEVSLFKRVIDSMRADDSTSAPAEDMVWAKNLFRTRRVVPRQTVVEKILAVLQVDLSQMSPAFGERSAAAAAQMLFQAGENSVDLRVAPGEKGLTLRGQILGGGFENSAVILRSGKKEIKTQANEMAEFTITSIKAGTYEMSVISEAKEIKVENLVLK